MTSAPPLPNSEALALSASIFTSSIASWLPADFGAVRSEVDKNKDFELALRESRGDRLGLGHPSLEERKGQSSSSRSAGLGFAGLSRKLGNEKKAKQKESGRAGDDALINDDDDEGEEEESRARSVGKGRKPLARGVLDPFASKKKKKVASQSQTPSNTSSQRDSPADIPGSQADTSQSSESANIVAETVADEDAPELLGNASPSGERLASGPSTPPRTTTTSASASSPGGSGVFPFDGPRAVNSPQAKRVVNVNGKRRPDDAKRDEKAEKEAEAGKEVEEADKASQSSQGVRMSKTQQRREKRKRARLEKASD